jgi:predicted anti-sigma-YlaC factor YlaD
MTDKTTCDDSMVSVMALADGETPPMSAEAVREHLASCAACSAWSDEIADTARLLGACRRPDDPHDLWPALAPRLAPPGARLSRVGTVAPFVALAAILVAFRLLLYGAAAPEMALKLTAVALAVSAFLVVRENPFKIEAERPLGAE